MQAFQKDWEAAGANGTGLKNTARQLLAKMLLMRLGRSL